MDLELSKEQKALKNSAREFLKKECPPEQMRNMRDDQEGYSSALWKKMAELGWMGVMIPEKYEGLGGDFVDLSIILESMGEVCCPGPFFSTVVLGGLTLLAAGSEEQKSELLPKLVNGDLVMTLAQNEPGTWFNAGGVKTAAKKKGADYIIEGTKLFVENAHIADYVICVAKTGDNADPEKNLSLFLVDGKDPSVNAPYWIPWLTTNRRRSSLTKCESRLKIYWVIRATVGKFLKLSRIKPRWQNVLNWWGSFRPPLI